jgi:hypothetical protein
MREEGDVELKREAITRYGWNSREKGEEGRLACYFRLLVWWPVDEKVW